MWNWIGVDAFNSTQTRPNKRRLHGTLMEGTKGRRNQSSREMFNLLPNFFELQLPQNWIRKKMMIGDRILILLIFIKFT